MSAKRFTLDTNILVYAVDSGDERRHSHAHEIIESMLTQACVLTTNIHTLFIVMDDCYNALELIRK